MGTKQSSDGWAILTYTKDCSGHTLKSLKVSLLWVKPFSSYLSYRTKLKILKGIYYNKQINKQEQQAPKGKIHSVWNLNKNREEQLLWLVGRKLCHQ